MLKAYIEQIIPCAYTRYRADNGKLYLANARDIEQEA